jgi:CBS domain-containing protein
MLVQDIMTGSPACCTPDTRLQEVARLMVEQNCGAIPIVDNQDRRIVMGIVTDRDIVCRTLAQGKDPLLMTADDCLTNPVAVISPYADVDECCKLMEQQHVRRIPVVDDFGRCCGIVSQCDIAAKAPEHETAEVVREISLAA